MNQKGFSSLILILVIVLLITASAGSYYLGTKAMPSPKQSIVSTTTPLSSASPSPVASIADQTPSLLGESKKRFYDPAKVFTGKALYPTELTSVPEKDLSSLECSPSFRRDDPNNRYVYYKDGSSNPTTMSDSKLTELAEKSFEVDFGGEDYLACRIDDGRYIVIYSKPYGGGGSGNKVGVGLLTGETYEKITEIVTDGSPYFGCSSPLQLSKTNILWYSCGGGDGAYAANSIYKIDLSAKTNNRLIKCETSYDLDEQGISEKCE